MARLALGRAHRGFLRRPAMCLSELGDDHVQAGKQAIEFVVVVLVGVDVPLAEVTTVMRGAR